MKYWIFLFLGFLFHSCTTDKDGAVPSGSLAALLPQRNWSVSDFRVDGNDRLFLFGGYRFQFTSNGNVSARKGTVSALGTWSSGMINGKTMLYFDFGSTPDFSQLTGQWENQTQTALQGQFIRRTGSGSEDHLTLDAI